ncbi:MAG: hypothetical protein ACP5H8_01865 [Candidatus Micrarchaeia archaeon]
MYNKLVLFGVLAVFILLFGCIQQPKVDGQPGEKSTEEVQEGSVKEGKTQVGEEQGKTGDGVTGMVAGPVKCTIETIDPPTKIVYYYNGIDRIRVESEAEGTKVTNIVKGKEVYTKVDEYMAQAFPECSWMKYIAKPGSASTSDLTVENFEDTMYQYSNMPNYKISCAPWTVDASVFETPGKICEFPG